MKVVRACLVGWMAVVWMLLSSTARAEPATISLHDLIVAARRNPPQVLGALASLERRDAEHHQARGAYLPTLTAQVNVGSRYTRQPLTDSLRYDQITRSYGGSLSADLQLMNPSRRKAVQAARQRQRAAADQLEDIQRVAVAAAVELYVRALAAQELVEDAQVTSDRRVQQLNAVAGLVAAGLRPSVDETRTRVEAVSARYTVRRRMVERQQAYAALARSVGRDPAEGLKPQPLEDLSPVVPDSIPHATELALDHRPDLRALRARVLAEQSEVKSTLLRRLPVLGLSASGSVDDQKVLWSADGDEATTVAEGVTYLAQGMIYLRWNGLDASLFRSADVSRAKANEARRQLEQAVLDVRAQVADALYAVRLAEQETQRAKHVLEAAEETLEAQTHRYEVGAASLLDLLDAEGLAQTAQRDAIESERDLTVARLRLLAACATLQPSLR